MLLFGRNHTRLTNWGTASDADAVMDRAGIVEDQRPMLKLTVIVVGTSIGSLFNNVRLYLQF